MLHILLLIIKIIAIILAVILGILVLLIGTVLFVPFKYEAASDCDGTLDGLGAYLKCTWLFRIIRISALYKEKKFQWKLKILWFEFPRQEEETIQSIKEGVKKHEEEHDETVEKTKEEPERSTENIKSIEQKAEEKSGLSERAESQREKAEETIRQEESGAVKKSSKFKEICEKIRKIYEKIKCTFQNMCGKMKALMVKKDKLSDFIHNEIHKKAFIQLKNEAFHLLRRLKPRKLKANIRYGFDDPCTTGQVLAGLSIAYPFIGKHTVIIPDFEHKVLEGDLYVKGKIRGIYFMILVWNLFWCKAVRTTYKDIRNFKI